MRAGKISAGVTVAYVVGTQAIEGVEMILGNADVAVIDVEAAVASSKRFDFIVEAEALMLGSTQVEPSRGHEIWRTLADGRKAVYEVLPLANDRCYSPSGQFEHAWRIHTKLKEIEAAP